MGARAAANCIRPSSRYIVISLHRPSLRPSIPASRAQTNASASSPTKMPAATAMRQLKSLTLENGLEVK